MRALLDDLHLHWLQQRRGAGGCDDVGHQLVVPFGERGQANHRAPAAFNKICSAIGGGYPRAAVEIPNGPGPLITRQKPHFLDGRILPRTGSPSGQGNPVAAARFGRTLPRFRSLLVVSLLQFATDVPTILDSALTGSVVGDFHLVGGIAVPSSKPACFPLSLM